MIAPFNTSQVLECDGKGVLPTAHRLHLRMLALEAAVPVLAAAVGGVADAFSDGIEGRVIPLDAADAAAQIILDWWDRPGRLESAGRAARDRFECRYETSAVAARLARFLCDPSAADD